MSTIELLQALHPQIVDFDLLVRGRHPETGSTGMEIQVSSVAPGFLEAVDLFSRSWIEKTTCFVIRHRSDNVFFGSKSGASDPSIVSLKKIFLKRIREKYFCYAMNSLTGKRIDELMLRRRPDLDRFIFGGRDQFTSIRTEVHAPNGRGVGLEIRTTTLDVVDPQPDTLVS